MAAQQHNVRQLESCLSSIHIELDAGSRERRSNKRKSYFSTRRKAPLYDDKGVLLASGTDTCDCLQPQCGGCHWPCAACGSTRCGHECRAGRRWMYDQVDVEGSDHVLKNPHRS